MLIFKKMQDKENPYDTKSVEVTTVALTLDDIFEDFKGFLQASGFIINGDIVIEETPEQAQTVHKSHDES